VKNRKILVIDIGGTAVKLMMSARERRKFNSGPHMTPGLFARRLKQTVRGWKFDAISIGFPAPVRQGHIVHDPKHLGPGWARYDFRKALKKPIVIVNDAAMQALGSYRSRRMLFLGLGTGLGSAMVWKNTLLQLELGDLPYRDGKIIEQFLGKPGLARLGERAWKSEVRHAVLQLKKCFVADYVVLGGGNAKRFKTLPEGIRPGHNRNAYLGGVRLWETDSRTKKKKWSVL
jgi:predicted NBD/HSP70 family sugar kinase